GVDVQSTISCLTGLGVKVERNGKQARIHGHGLRGLRPPSVTLNVGNSGTTIRLLSGILAAQEFDSEITGDGSILKRPMDRIIRPLSQMGAKIQSKDGRYAPLRFEPSELSSIRYNVPVASAQVKSCLLFAALYANGMTHVTELSSTRDHTERMLQNFGANVNKKDLTVSMAGPAQLEATSIYVPGDLSSAAFFIAAATLVPDSELMIKNVGLNPTRSAFVSVLTKMGAKVDVVNFATVNNEFYADLLVRSSGLNGVVLNGNLIPQLIDEIPIIAVMATQASGRTEIRNASELRYKETDRIRAVAVNLSKMGADVEEVEDGLIIHGPMKLSFAELESFDDHRIAMAFSVAGLVSDGGCLIKDSECADISFTKFYEKLEEIKIA
ncbi:3-phosphoshikimate 1-carboxyvinyltransferase, partial [candidate division KSB1 bacterium]|nr:3-phosphoshikimate 1-carboxyvinyltransferase [candidate division KSB1 bacterium]NIR69847.1 3-phosphoshikimate 1-carboxyvinyltransferase [candidate division KSB1 bacterium]NIS24394.1 3-phosphoshikimate 1-carboxyvinyltransferase [candidate division KSB1 bacterium]NIT71330.1 3-phosphoshikimate 1-carboxyvinyltransferase [candidate division KSB1 bacterium]NIU27625.1 3-phosphoshikimate 1-carboxyvinyltransferase [candidate division KSB1 bacterium]